MFEKTNQTMEEIMENLPENLFEDAEDAGMQDEGGPSTAPVGSAQDDRGERFGSAQDDRGARASQSPGASEEGNGAGGESGKARNGDGQGEGDPSAALRSAQDDRGGSEARPGGNHTEGIAPANVLRVKYNGEERDLSFEEARTLAQKGLNYDHVVSERDRNRNAFDFLMERAKGEGITVEQLIANERGKAENQRLEAKMREIRERDDDAREETIKSLAQFELEAEARNKQKEREQAEAQALETKKNAENEGWNRLFREHPELVAKEGEQVSPEVVGLFELIGQGYTPVEAYYIKRAREMETQNRMKADSDAAKKKSIGSLSGVQSTEAEDDFLAGFFGAK